MQIPAFTFSETESKALSAEVEKLLEKQAISPTEAADGFISNVFLVPKKEDQWRLILNLKALNEYTEREHFKMEDIRSVKDLLNRGDYMCKLDLKDAYLSVPINPAHRKYLQFQWEGVTYQYNALPFGLATAPRTFTKILKPILAHLRAKGLRLVAYLDDILIIGKNKAETEQAYLQTKELLESLGFVINVEKSLPEASQCIEFLGFMINSHSMSFKLPIAKVKEIRSKCKQALREKKLSVRQLAHLIGVLSSTHLAVLPAPLHYRGLQTQKIQGLLHHRSYESMVTLENRSQMDLKWWINNLETNNGRPIHLDLPEMTIESDASNTGWGACWNNQRTGGQWSFQESQLHINAKELLAAFLALQTFVGSRKGIHVLLKIDNMTAVYYINRMGGTHSKKLMEITAQVWNWSLERKIFLSAEHIPGIQNVDADRESRRKGDSSEWKLDPAIFQQVMQILGPCQVDLFASRISAQLPVYMSWKPDPGSIATDALSQSWTDIKGYAFPPFSLIGRCLSKVQRERVKELILVAPVWPSQPWFAVLLSMLFQRPLLLPKQSSLLTNHNNESHPLAHQLSLAVWPISGVPSIIKEFQAKQQPLFCLHGERPQRQHTPAAGRDGSSGVPHVDAMLFKRL